MSPEAAAKKIQAALLKSRPPGHHPNRERPYTSPAGGNFCYWHDAEIRADWFHVGF